MSEPANYDALYDQSIRDLPKPKNLPAGHYVLKLNALFFNPREGDKAPMVNPRFTAVKPLGDVNKNELAALGEGYNFGLNDEIRVGGESLMFWGSVRQQAAVKEFLEVFGVELPDAPLWVPGDDGTPRANPKVMEVLKKGAVVGELSLDEYQGTVRNVADHFVRVGTQK